MLSLNTGAPFRAGPPGSFPIPTAHRAVAIAGISLISTRISGTRSCDNEFRKLPRGRTFGQMLGLPLIVHYDPSNRRGDWGWTMPLRYPWDVVISQYTLRMGHWAVAGTIVHEIAHLNGADGKSHAAEHTLTRCLLNSPRGPYNPLIRG